MVFFSGAILSLFLVTLAWQRMEGGWVPKVYVSGDRRSRYGNSVGGGVYLLTHYKGWELSNKYMDEEKVIKALQSPGNENIKHSSSAGL